MCQQSRQKYRMCFQVATTCDWVGCANTVIQGLLSWLWSKFKVANVVWLSRLLKCTSFAVFFGLVNQETFSIPPLWCDAKDDCAIILIKRICLWSCELEYFTHWFVATVRATSGFQSPDQSAPGSTSVSRGPAFSAIHDLSYIFRPAVQQN